MGAIREESQSMAEGVEWFVGIDWASQSHQVCLIDAHGECLGERAVAHGGAGIEELNPRGLPVGFAIRQLDFPSKPPYQYWKGEWVGFACAACHTGQVRYHGQEIRLEGGPAHLDIEAFGDELKAALTATVSMTDSWRRALPQASVRGSCRGYRYLSCPQCRHRLAAMPTIAEQTDFEEAARAPPLRFWLARRSD
jgi:hypothetical protein